MERNGTLRALEGNLLEAKVFAQIMADMQITDTIVSEDTAAIQDVARQAMTAQGRRQEYGTSADGRRANEPRGAGV